MVNFSLTGRTSIWGLILCCLGLLMLPPPLSQSVRAAAKAEDLPLTITAGRLEVDHTRQEIAFRDQVVARYKDLILYADLVKIFYQAKAAAPEKGKPESPLETVGIERINLIEALGQVRLVQEDRVATGDQAVYYPQDEKIVLRGNPQLWRGQNSIRGQEITFFIKENRAVVSGQAAKRVEAVLYPATQPGAAGKPSLLPRPGKP